MSEFELVEAVNSTMSIHASVLLGYLTVISAYLVAAFVAGGKFTQQQSFMVSVLFIFASGLTVFAIWGTGSRIAYLAEVLKAANPEHPISYNNGFRNGLVILTAMGVVASLKFMWDVRHPRVD